MSSSMDKLAKELKTMMTASDDRKPKPYDTQAEVLRVEDGIAWVHIPGGVDETPVRLTLNAKKGDTVNIHVANGSAWVTGNSTSPPTDDTTANVAKEKANYAEEKSNKAMDASVRANLAADNAELEAKRAKDKADIVETVANASRDLLEEMEEAADAAGTSLTQIYNDAMQAADAADRAEIAAGTAQTSAAIATSSANAALDQLGIVEDVVGVLEMIQTHGDYQVTSDSIVVPDKWYFTRSGESPNYIYSVVNNPASIEYAPTTDTSVDSGKTYYSRSGTGAEGDPYVYTAVEPVGTEDPSSEGWYECIFYELIGVDTTIQNYIANQLVVDNQGLWLKRPESTGIKTKVLLSSTDGVVLFDENGNQVGQYGSTAIVGDPQRMHITMTGTRLSFYDGANEVAYIDGQKLYITQTIVLEQMDLGLPFGYVNPVTHEVGKGQWSWKVHPNDENPPRNNLNLKWVG